MNDFLRNLKDGDENMPGTVQDLEGQLGVRITVADRTDPEEVGFVQWRPAFYVAGLDWPNGTHVSRLGEGVVYKFSAPRQVTSTTS